MSLRLLGQVQCVTVYRFQPILTYPLVVSSLGHLFIESVIVLININGGQSVSSVHPRRTSQGLVLCSNVRLGNKSCLQAYSCDGAMSREPTPSWNTNHHFSSKIDPTTTSSVQSLPFSSKTECLGDLSGQQFVLCTAVSTLVKTIYTTRLFWSPARWRYGRYGANPQLSSATMELDGLRCLVRNRATA